MKGLADQTAEQQKQVQAEIDKRASEQGHEAWATDEESIQRGTEYFQQRLENPETAQDEMNEEFQERNLVRWDSEQWSVFERLQMRIHSIASLAASATEATSVLLTNASLPVSPFSQNILI